MVVEERNFAELSGEFPCDDFRKRHEAGLRVGRHGEATLERARASAVQTQALNTKVSPRLKATVGLKQTRVVEFAM
jgi:hypothetical protein